MSFPRYPEYKDSGVEWLGEVPGHWEAMKLSHTLKSAPCYGVLVPDFEEDGVPMLRITDMENGNADRASLNRISKALSAQYSRTIIEEGDVVLSVVGTIGEAFQVDSALAGVNLSRAVARIQPSYDLAAAFLCWVFQTVQFRRYVDLICVGTAQRVLNMGDLSAFQYAKAPIDEQAQIASFLNRETAKIDALVAEQRRLMELLKEKRQAVISHAVTRGLNPNAPMKPSGIEWLGDVPEHWEVRRVKDYFETSSGGTPNTAQQELYYSDEESGTPWVRTTDLQNDILHSVEIYITDKALSDTACSVLPPGTVMVAMYGGDGTVGKNGLLAIPAAINQAVCGLLPSSTHSPEYAFRFMQFYRPHWMIGAESSRKDPNISQERVRNAPFPRPPREEQDSIVSFLDSQLTQFDTLTTESQRAIDLLQERRTALISAAVTGQIDVRKQSHG